MPYFSANPLLGLICASKPGGKAILIPVDINLQNRGGIITVASTAAHKSTPAEPGVAYLGIG